MNDTIKNKQGYDPADASIESANSVSQLLKNLSPDDFLNMGLQDFAYIKEVSVDDKLAFSIHAANGNTLSISDSWNEAIGLLVQHNLHGVTVH